MTHPPQEQWEKEIELAQKRVDDIKDQIDENLRLTAQVPYVNTPDTEWEKLANMVIRMMEGRYNSNDARKADVKNAIKSFLTSHDTYWKERVEETRTTLLFIGEKVLKEMSEIYAVDIKYADKKQWLEPSEFERIFLHRLNEAGLKALDTLLDNLK